MDHWDVLLQQVINGVSLGAARVHHGLLHHQN